MSFKERNHLVRQIGLPDYLTYLESETWARIRRRVLRRANNRCCCCDNTVNQVHHSKYTQENLAGESVVGLHAICDECHQLVHLNGDQFIELTDSENRLTTFIKADERKLPPSRRRKHKKTSRKTGSQRPKQLRLCERCNQTRDILQFPLKQDYCGTCLDELKRLRKNPLRVECPRCKKMRKPNSMLKTGYCTVCKNRIAKGTENKTKSKRQHKLRLIDTMKHVPINADTKTKPES